MIHVAELAGCLYSLKKFVESHQGNVNEISIYGQESNPDTWKLAKMNLGIRGIPCNLGEKNADTFGEDLHKDLKVDYIIANPPFNLKDWRGENELLNSPRWAGYGVPPVSNANYAWILHMLSKLSVNGVAGFLLANGALNDTDTVEIRKNLVKNGKIEAIIILPREMFYYTDISVTLWIMNNNKGARSIQRDGKEVKLRDRTDEVLMIDLRRMGHKTSEGYIELDPETDMKLVKETLNNWQSVQHDLLYQDVPEFCQSVTVDEIRNCVSDRVQEINNTNISLTEDESNWSLVPSKYIEFIDHDLEINFDEEMRRIQISMRELLNDEKQSQDALEKAFKGIGYEID